MATETTTQTTPDPPLAGLAARLDSLLPADARNRADRLAAAARIEAARSAPERVHKRSGEVSIPTDSRVLLDSDQAALLLGVPVSTVQALSRNGDLPTVRIGPKGRTYRYRLAAIEAWIEAAER